MNPFDTYIKMCRAATDIQELKFVREYEGDELIWREFRFEKGDYYAYYNSVIQTDTEYIYTENNSPYSLNQRLAWLPTFEQCLHIYSEKKDICQESLSLLWLANWFEDKIAEDHEFCFTYETKEEIALLWVQETCFNQVWDGEKWIQNI